MSSPLPPVDGTRRAPAPRVGAPSTFGAKAARMKRQQKLGMWSAVALQQHFALSGGAQALTSAAGGPNSDGRCERTPLQSLPAAVVAYPTSRLPRNTTHGQHRADEDGSRPRLTLAQKMNLVPAPPPPPTEDDWHAVETRALLRAQHEYEDARAAAAAAATAAGRQVTHHHHSSSSTAAFASFAAQVCSICRDPFCFAAGSPSLASRHQGFVILSCSHVFHETCFRQFERLIRLQQRAEAAAALSSGGASVGALMTRLACPECRSTNYFKRTYFSGPAMAERAALVRIQAVVRGFLARRRWRAARLRSNPQFRDAFVESRLTRLANAWDRCLTRQANQREALLLSLDVQRQEAAAAFLSESEWQDIIEKRLGMNCPDATSTPSCSCAICLEDVQCALRPSQALMLLRRRGRHGSRSSSPPSPQPSTTIATDTDPAAAAAASVVAEMRANYEERRAATRKGKAKPTRRDGGRPLARHRGARHTPAKCSRDRGNAQVDTEGERPASVNPNNANNNDPASSSPRVESPELSADAGVPGPRASPRYGVILSCCGQVFHEACLEVLERYTERNATTSAPNTASAADSGPVPFQRRCPLCRRGYGKHAF